eukprot:10279997-Ditylum_brightwellii.AAC.1
MKLDMFESMAHSLEGVGTLFIGCETIVVAQWCVRLKIWSKGKVFFFALALSGAGALAVAAVCSSNRA